MQPSKSTDWRKATSPEGGHGCIGQVDATIEVDGLEERALRQRGHSSIGQVYATIEYYGLEESYFARGRTLIHRPG